MSARGRLNFLDLASQSPPSRPSHQDNCQIPVSTKHAGNVGSPLTVAVTAPLAAPNKSILHQENQRSTRAFWSCETNISV